MPRRVPLPAALTRGAFLTRDAAAAGIGEGRLRGSDLSHPHHGLISTKPATTVVERCREFAPLLRDGDFFSHTTAARLWGCPFAIDAAPDEPLHVSSRSPLTPVRRPGIIGHRATPAELDRRFGFPVSAPATTWLAPLLPIDELVVVADHLVLDPRRLEPLDIRPYATVERLSEASERFHGRGARVATSALRLVRIGAESRPESLLRLLLARAGLPEPELQAELRSGPRLLGFVEHDYAVVRVRSRGLFVTPADTIACGWTPRARKSA